MRSHAEGAGAAETAAAEIVRVPSPSVKPSAIENVPGSNVTLAPDPIPNDFGPGTSVSMKKNSDDPSSVGDGKDMVLPVDLAPLTAIVTPEKDVAPPLSTPVAVSMAKV